MTKQTKRRIRNTVKLARGVFFALSIVFFAVCYATADGESLKPFIVHSVMAIISFGISFFCDRLLGDGENSLFYH